MKITHRSGFPFSWPVCSAESFCRRAAALFALSSMVWDVEVKGNVTIPTDEVLAAAKRKASTLFNGVPDEKSGQAFQTAGAGLPDVTWIGVTKEGTRVTIQVVESAQPKREPLLNPRHLISKTDAVVTQIYAEQGRPVVQKDMRVKKGQVLISGILGDEENTKTIVAKGEVRGMVWREYEIQVPLIQKRQTMTGRVKSDFMWCLETGQFNYGDTEVLPSVHMTRTRITSL